MATVILRTSASGYVRMQAQFRMEGTGMYLEQTRHLLVRRAAVFVQTTYHAEATVRLDTHCACSTSRAPLVAENGLP